MIPITKQIDFINLSKELIPIELVFILGNAEYSLQNAKIIISENLNKFLKQFHQEI